MKNIYLLRVSSVADRVAEKLHGKAHVVYTNKQYRVSLVFDTGITYVTGKYNEVLCKLWAMYDALEIVRMNNKYLLK